MPNVQKAESRLLAQLRGAILRSGLSRGEIARRSGLSTPTISRFVAKKTRLTLDADFDRLLRVLGFEVGKRRQR